MSGKSWVRAFLILFVAMASTISYEVISPHLGAHAEPVAFLPALLFATMLARAMEMEGL